MLTHVGRLRHFPFPFNLSYYGPNLTANLLSLGNFQHLGGWYGVDPTNHHRLLLKSSLKGATIGTATLSTSNLLPVTLPFSPLPPCPLLRPLSQPYTVPLLRALHTPHPTSTPSSPQDTTTTPPSTSPHDLTTTSSDTTVLDLDTTPPTSHSPGPDSILHQHSYNTEQRLRASLVLHQRSRQRHLLRVRRHSAPPNSCRFYGYVQHLRRMRRLRGRQKFHSNSRPNIY